MATTKSKPTNGSAPAQIDEAVDAGLNAAESAMRTNAQAALKSYETLVAMGRDALDAACKAAKEIEGFDQAVALPKANFEAFVGAGNAMVRGFEAFNGRMFDLARTQVAEGVAAQKALMDAKTFQEAIGIQQDFVRRTIERAMHDGVELSGAWVRAATEAAQQSGHHLSEVPARASQKAA